MMLPIIFKRRNRAYTYSNSSRRGGYGGRRNRHFHWWRYLLIMLLLLGMAVWLWYFLYPLSPKEQRESDATIVTETRYVLLADSVEVLSFTDMKGDTLLSGVSDSVKAVDTIPAQWTLRWQNVPFSGRRLVQMPFDTASVCKMSSEKLKALLRREAQYLAAVKTVTDEQKVDIDYYLRTHTVIDDGFDIVARYSKELNIATDSLAHAANLIAKALKGKQLSVRLDRQYRLIGDSGRIYLRRFPCREDAVALLKERVDRMPKAPSSAIDSIGTYSGERDSVAVPHGYGRFQSRNGDFYEGEWQHGKRSGVGFSIIPGKRLRLGEWKDDAFLGERIAYTPERIYGIDISRHQHEKGKKKYSINWKDLRITSLGHKSKKNIKGVVDYPVRFVYIKATEGVTVRNKYFAGDYAAARKNGYKTGAYHFFSIKTPGKNQAINFLRNSRYNYGDLPPVLDIEPTDKQIAQAGGIYKLFNNVRQWLNAVEGQYKVRPILYVSQRFVNKYLPLAPDLMKGYDVWIARYGEYKPDVNLIYWQLSPDGRVNGIHGEVDINVLNGFSL